MLGSFSGVVVVVGPVVVVDGVDEGIVPVEA